METIEYTQLNPDNCNIQDYEFERGVNRFMERFMPGFPISLLEKDYERWELEPLGTCEVDEIEDGLWEVVDNYGDTVQFADEGEAEEFAQEQNEEAEEGRYGFPWANGWCFYPDSDISDEDLRAAGYVIALYTDGDGDQVRLCGIDGGGYCFMGAHHSKLYALDRHRKSLAVQTSDGPRLVTFQTN